MLLLRPATAIIINARSCRWYRVTMSKAEKVAFIVKFVESEGSKKDCAAKAYKVSSTAWSSLSSSVYCLFVLQIGNHVCPVHSGHFGAAV